MIKKIFIPFSFVVLGSVLVCFAASFLKNDEPKKTALVPVSVDTPQVKRSSLEFSEREIKLAPVTVGTVAASSVTLTNVGDYELTDIEILTGCHCSTTDFSKKILQPKETVGTTFSIDTAGRNGTYRANFVVKYRENGESKFDVFYASVPIVATGKLVSYPTSLIFEKAKPGLSFARDIEIYLKGVPQNDNDVINVDAPPWMESEVFKKPDRWLISVSGILPDFSRRKVANLFVRGKFDRPQVLLIPVIMEPDSEP